MSRHLRALMCLLGFLAAGTGTVAGAGECGPYQVTFYEFGSLYYKDEAGNFVGIDKDVIDELGRRTGCRFQGVLDSRVRTWAHMADGTLDMTVSGVATPEREAFAEFIPYSNSRNFLIVRPELAEKVLSLRAFTADKRLRLAVVKSFKHGNTLDVWIDALRAQGRVDEYGDAEVVARIFAGGRADAFLSQPVTWGPLLARNALEGKVRKLDVAPQDRAIGSLVLSRKRVSVADVASMRKALEAMRADGTLEKIFARFVDAGTAHTMALAVSPP